MKKRDLTTKELALYLHTDVAEARRLKQTDAEKPSIDTAVASAATESKEDSSAAYCRTRTDGRQHSIEYRGQKYCTLPRFCRCQVQNGAKAKLCRYKFS